MNLLLRCLVFYSLGIRGGSGINKLNWGTVSQRSQTKKKNAGRNRAHACILSTLARLAALRQIPSRIYRRFHTQLVEYPFAGCVRFGLFCYNAAAQDRPFSPPPPPLADSQSLAPDVSCAIQCCFNKLLSSVIFTPAALSELFQNPPLHHSGSSQQLSWLLAGWKR